MLNFDQETTIKYYDDYADNEESFGKHKDRKKPKGKQKKADLYLEKKAKRSSLDRFSEPSLQQLFELGYITDILGELKSGKEATVFLAEGPAGQLAAKIYRDKVVRSFQKDEIYKRGRHIPKAHYKKIEENRERLNVSRDEAHWIYHEYMQLWELYEAGIAVPTPIVGPGANEIARAGRVLLMEFIGQASEAAPRLADIKLNEEEAQSAWEQSLTLYQNLLKLGKIHGDYSSYNLLWWQGKVIAIDFPQMMDSSQFKARELFERDIHSLVMSFKRHNIELDPHELSQDILTRTKLSFG